MKACVLACGLSLLVVVASCDRSDTPPAHSDTSAVTPESGKRTVLTPPSNFGYKTAWFAIRTIDTNAVAAAFDLRNAAPASWDYGINYAYGPRTSAIFVTPPVNGWTLVMGEPVMLGEMSQRMDQATRLSLQFREVQFYGSHRVSDVYVWGRAVKGKLVRFFAEEDGNRREIGPRTEMEKALFAKFFDPSSPESKQPGYWSRKDLTFLDEETVLKIAAAWSINPEKLEEMGLPPALGLLGDPPPGYYERIP